MKSINIAFGLTISISTFSLAAGFLHGGYWMIVALYIPFVLLVLIFRHRSLFWLGTVYLSISLLLAAFGVLVQIPLLPMIIAGGAALASWDLYLFKHDIDSIIPEKSKPAMIKDHFSSLGLAISCGFILAVTFSYFKFKLPFGLSVLFVLITMVCLMISVKILNRKR